MEEKELDLDLDFRDLIYDYENRVSRVQEIKARRIKNGFTPHRFSGGGGLRRKGENEKIPTVFETGGPFPGFL